MSRSKLHTRYSNMLPLHHGRTPSDNGQCSVNVVFALTPGQLSGNDLLDYSTTDGIKQFHIATSSLYTGDDEDKFDYDAAGLRDFLQLLETHSNNYSWDIAVLDVALDPNDLINSERVNLMTHHGELTVEQVLAHVEVYINTPS